MPPRASGARARSSDSVLAKGILFVFLALNYLPVPFMGLNLFQVLGAALAGLSLLSVLQGRKGISSHPFYVAVIGMIFFGVLGSWSSQMLNGAQVAKMGQNLLLLWIIADRSGSPGERRLVLGGLAFGAMTSVLLGLGAIEGLVPGERLSGILGNANGYGQACVQAAICSVGLLAEYRGLLPKLAGAAVAVVCMLGLLYSGSRGAGLSLVFAVLAVVYLRSTRASGVIVAAGLAAVVSVAMPEAYSDRWKNTFQVDKPFRRSGVEGRYEVWEKGWRVFVESPIVGVGSGNAMAAIERRDPTEGAQVTHNVLLQCLVETGILGTLPFAFLLWQTGRCFRRIAEGRHAQRGGTDPVGAACFVLLVAVLVGQLSSGNYVHAIWYILFGLALGGAHQQEGAPRLRAGSPRRMNRSFHHSRKSPHPIPPSGATADGMAPAAADPGARNGSQGWPGPPGCRPSARNPTSWAPRPPCSFSWYAASFGEALCHQPLGAIETRPEYAREK